MLNATGLQTMTPPPQLRSALAFAVLLAQTEPAADTNAASAVTASVAATATEVTFDILEFRVQGATLLPAVNIELVLYPFMGTQKTLQDVEKARLALEQAYKDAGYPTGIVSIPEQ